MLAACVGVSSSISISGGGLARAVGALDALGADDGAIGSFMVSPFVGYVRVFTKTLSLRSIESIH
jgi:hypothetical protein